MFGLARTHSLVSDSLTPSSLLSPLRLLALLPWGTLITTRQNHPSITAGSWEIILVFYAAAEAQRV